MCSDFFLLFPPSTALSLLFNPSSFLIIFFSLFSLFLYHFFSSFFLFSSFLIFSLKNAIYILIQLIQCTCVHQATEVNATNQTVHYKYNFKMQYN